MVSEHACHLTTDLLEEPGLERRAIQQDQPREIRALEQRFKHHLDHPGDLGGGVTARLASASLGEPPVPQRQQLAPNHCLVHAPLVAKVQIERASTQIGPLGDLTDGNRVKGSVQEGAIGKADCTLEIADSDFLDMTSGKSDPMKLFTTGKLKISGNVMASQKLE